MSLDDYEIAQQQRIAMDEASKRAEAWMNIQKAYGSNPDDEAKKVSLQKSTGIPSTLMTDPEVRAEAERTHITKSIDLAKSPATAAHLANEENALVSGDMITGMMTMEDKIKEIKSWWTDVFKPTPVRAATQTIKGASGAIEYLITGGVAPIAGINAGPAVSGLLDIAGIGTKQTRQWREAANAVEKQIDLEHPLPEDSWKRFAANALSSTATQLPFLGAGYLSSSANVAKWLVLGAMGTQTFGQTYGDRVDAGFGKLESTLSGIWDGSVEVGTEVWGVGTLFKMFKPTAKQAFSKFLVNAGKYFGQDVLGELAATALQTSNQRAMARPDMTAQERADAIGDYFASGDAWNDAKATFKTTLIQSTLMTGMGIGINRLKQGALPKAEAENKAIMDVLESKELDRLYQRSPENFSDWMQTAGDRHGISKIYLQADRVIEEGLKNGITEEQIPEWLAQYGVSPQELTTAIQTNGNLAMDFGKVALGYKQDRALNGLQKDFLADVKGTSLNQVESAVQEETEHFARLDELYAKAQANKIGQQDIDTWSEAILNNPELQGRVTTESLMPLIARANMLSALTNTPAIEHLNRLIQPQNIKRLKDYTELQESLVSAIQSTVQPTVQPETPVQTERMKIQNAFRQSLGITTDPGILDFTLYAMADDLSSGQKGGLQGKDEATGEGVYRKSGHAKWYRELSKEFSKAKTSPTGKIESIGAKEIGRIIKKGVNGNKLTPRQKVIWERLNQIADREAWTTYEPLIRQYNEARSRENEQIGNIIADEGLDAATIRENREQIVAHLESKIAEEGDFKDLSEEELARNADEIASFFDDMAAAADKQEAEKTTAGLRNILFQGDIYGSRGINQESIPDMMYQNKFDTDPLAATYQMAGQNIIALFEKSDKSSFLHETAHIFLNDLKYVSENLGVQGEEWTRAKEWLGIGPDGVITKEQHERFAEHFEAYLKTGRAPVPEMKGAFRKFKRWLTAIYDHVRSRRSGQLAEIKINPEISDLFDRLLATEQEIETARNEAAAIAILDEQMLSEMGATPEQIKEYLDSNIQADDSARERRDKYKLEDREERVKAWKKQAEEESLKEPIYQFLSKARKDGINKESAQAVIGELPDLPGVWRKDGLDINAALAEYGGFNTIGDLAEAFRNYKPRQLWIEQRVGILETVHDSSQDTREAIRTSALRRMMEIESQWMAKKLEGQQVRESLPRSAMRAWAERTIADWGMTKIRGTDRLIAESRRHRQKALLSARQGNWDMALTENERARMTEELLSASYRAINNYKKMELRWKHISKWTNDNKNVKVGERFRVQINRVLTQYGIAIKEYDTKAEDIHSFVSTLASDDIEGIGGITFPEWIGQEFASYKKMSWGKLQELNDVIDCLYGKGREEVEGFKLSDGTKVEDKVNEIIKGQEGVKKLPDLKSDATFSGKILQGIQKKYRKFFAMTGILRFIAQRSDGYRNVGDKGTMGPAEKLVQNIVTAMGKSNDLWGDISVKVEPLLKILTKGRKTIYTDITVPENMKRNGMAWTKERVVSACLNMGNEQNLQRLMDGYKLDIYEIRKIAGKLTAEEWNAIQKIWNTVDSLWPKIAEVHEKINYFRPKKIEPTPITIHTADGADVRLEGGYYPAVYDKDIDRDIARWTEKDDILASHEAILQIPVAKSGFAKGRVQNVKRPLKLSLSVLSTHFNDTIRYITMAEAIRDADRVFGNSELANANTEIMGKDLQDMIRPALKNVIRPDVSAQNNIIELIRTRMSVFYLGWNFWTAIQNTTGIFPAMRQVGVGNYLNGIYQVMAHPYASYKAMLEISPYMRLRANNIERDAKRQIRDFKINGIEIRGKTYQYNDVVESGFAMIKFVDTVVSTPAWYGKYQSEMDKHGDVGKAVASADAAVNKAIGSGLSIDTTQFTRHPLLSMIAPFMSFAAVQQEVLATEREAWKSGKINTSEFLYGNLMTWVMPAVMSTFLQGVLMYGLWGALGGGDRKREKDLWDYTTDLLSYRLMGIPVVRDVYNAFLTGAEGKAPVTSARIPVTEGYKMLLQMGERTGRVAHDGSEKSVNNLIWSTSELASMVSGVPVARVYDKWQRGKKDIENGNGWAANYFIPQEKKK